ncbi:BnaCnng14080D [Brassica napus]|uniref:(rape) hypothetical protein n=1 Tax=Brassica napus TaxID=3708 RepID=A0A078I9T5_BRANA|nr:serine/threonine-protein kinase ZRK1 [Brassica napus]CAF1848958.1 unnamed protein product [Brassica napus]CDY46586.1 BnaCnng14080D [Brassica napus]
MSSSEPKMKSQKKERKGERFELFLQNGSTLLQQLIADCNGKSNPIRDFSLDQILKATNNFDPCLQVFDCWHYTWYKGVIDDRNCMINRFSDGEILGLGEGDAYNDMVISARVSNHKNFLKLLGCCLEFPLPVLVFDGAENGVLDQHGDACNGNNKMVLSWNQKLKIAKEVANAVTCLHTAFPRIIVHRDIKPMHIFLDKNWTPKLSDMLFSISLPEGKTQMVDKVIVGTFGYMDPSYLSTRLVTEYTDVFSFGILLLVLLIGNGRAAVSAGPDSQSVDILGYMKNVYVTSEMENISDERSRKREVVELALRCCEVLREDRPTMIHVAKELDRIEKSIM